MAGRPTYAQAVERLRRDAPGARGAVRAEWYAPDFMERKPMAERCSEDLVVGVQLKRFDV